LNVTVYATERPTAFCGYDLPEGLGKVKLFRIYDLSIGSALMQIKMLVDLGEYRWACRCVRLEMIWGYTGGRHVQFVKLKMIWGEIRGDGMHGGRGLLSDLSQAQAYATNKMIWGEWRARTLTS